MTDRLIGTRLGAYEVRALLGSGGMGSVYRGYDPDLAREVAIKVISAGGMLPDAVTRFRREARLAAGLRHPGIVQVYAFGEADGTLYMVQELLPGLTLAEQLRRHGRRPLAGATVQRIVAQLAAALDYAHARGVIHRDVKPGNALYNAAGDLVITDFGLARGADIQVTATGPGVLMGTPGYVAPEQAVSSTSVTPACDIYSLGVVLFELLTGRLPFEADTPVGLVLKHLYDAPPAPSALRAQLPRALDAVVLRALHKEPEARYGSAGSLASALADAWPAARAALKQQPDPARAVVRERAPRQAPRIAAPTAAKLTPRVVATAQPAPKAAPPPARATPRPEARPTPKLAPPAPRTPPRPAPRFDGPKTPAPKPPARQVVRPGPDRDRRRRVRVGLITGSAVGALILARVGVDLPTLSRGWAALLQILGL